MKHSHQTLTDEIERLYYKIGDVADMCGVAASALRFWEQQFKVAPAKRNHKGERMYSVPEVALFKVIGQAVEELKLTTVKRLLEEGGEERLQEVLDALANKKRNAPNV